MKFSEMKYSRPNLEDVQKLVGSALEKFGAAKSADDAFKAYEEIDTEFARFTTMGCLAFIRHSLDTTNEFYSAEQDYFDEVTPLIEELNQEVKKVLVNTPYRSELEREWGKQLFLNTEIQMKTFSPEIIPLMQEENKLSTEYDKLIASVQIEYDGKTLTLAQLEPYHLDVNAEVRRASWNARAAWFEEHKERLDSLFDELVKVRTKMAVTLGYKNYIELGYYRMTRNCYDADMVAKFRAGVKKYIVPLAETVKAQQAKRLGVDHITLYDNAFEFPDGNAKPKGTPEEIFAAGKRMYHELSAETAEFIDFMLENELLDVLTRKGKSGGGYCCEIPLYDSQFIFANFNGTSGDVDVFTHEAGHAFAGYRSRDVRPYELANQLTYEVAETHSMSMEFFTHPWMELFFGEQTEKYHYSHLSDALVFIPYGTMVDEFQHIVYENPELTPAQRNDVWKELESVYRPYLDQSEVAFYREGRRWQAQSHIYERPFYYIDYCLAQTNALAFWTLDGKDHADAWDKYMKFVSLAGKKTFTELNEIAGVGSPFDELSLKETAEAAAKWLEEHKI